MTVASNATTFVYSTAFAVIFVHGINVCLGQYAYHWPLNNQMNIYHFKYTVAPNGTTSSCWTAYAVICFCGANGFVVADDDEPIYGSFIYLIFTFHICYLLDLEAKYDKLKEHIPIYNQRWLWR